MNTTIHFKIWSCAAISDPDNFLMSPPYMDHNNNTLQTACCPYSIISNLTNTDFRLSRLISGDAESVMLTMEMETACSSKRMATTPLPHGVHMQKTGSI